MDVSDDLVIAHRLFEKRKIRYVFSILVQYSEFRIEIGIEYGEFSRVGEFSFFDYDVAFVYLFPVLVGKSGELHDDFVREIVSSSHEFFKRSRSAHP